MSLPLYYLILRRFVVSDRHIVIDAAILLIAIALTFLFLISEDIASGFFAYAGQHPQFHLNDIIFASAISCVYLLIFIIRRMRELHEKIKLANTDVLVDIFNRRKGTELLQDNIARANIHGVDFSVIMLDIDNFKFINDTYGHKAGDSVIKQLVAILRKVSRQEDVVIRWGGEEFIVGCQASDLVAAMKLAERLRLEIANFDFGLGIQVTASFGVSEHQLSESLDEFINRADHCLYQSKMSGKNQVQIHDSLWQAARKEIAQQKAPEMYHPDAFL